MTQKTPKLFISIVLFLALTVGIVYASNSTKEVIDYKKMSTSQLQEEVEKLSNQGQLPFEMGLELMSRWTEDTKEIN